MRRLETQGLLSSEWREENKRRKRFYRLLPAGEQMFDQLSAELRRINASLDRIIAEELPTTILDRYLYAVAKALPKQLADGDIVAEIADDLQSQIDEREATAGRPLTDDEIVPASSKHTAIRASSRHGTST